MQPMKPEAGEEEMIIIIGEVTPSQAMDATIGAAQRPQPESRRRSSTGGQAKAP